MCKGGKNLPSSYPCPCHPSGKRSGSLSLSLSLFLSLLSISVWWKRSYDRFNNKGPSCLCLDETLLSSLLPPPPLSMSSNHLWSHLLSLSFTPPPPPFLLTLSLPSCSISCCLLPLTGVAPSFFVRPSAIQSGDGIKNQKVSLSKRHPGWHTLMSPQKFEIHMLSHFILFPPSFTLSLSPSAFSFSSSSSSLSPSSAIMYYSVKKKETRRKENNVKRIVQVFLKAISFLLFFMFLLCEEGGKIYWII